MLSLPRHNVTGSRQGYGKGIPRSTGSNCRRRGIACPVPVGRALLLPASVLLSVPRAAVCGYPAALPRCCCCGIVTACRCHAPQRLPERIPAGRSKSPHMGILLFLWFPAVICPGLVSPLSCICPLSCCCLPLWYLCSVVPPAVAVSPCTQCRALSCFHIGTQSFPCPDQLPRPCCRFRPYRPGRIPPDTSGR